MPSPTFVGSSDSVTNTARTSVPLVVPAGTAVDDFAIVTIQSNTNAAVVVPAGWAAYANITGTAMSYAILHRRVTQADITAGTYTLSGLGNFRYAASMSVYRNVHLTNPFDLAAGVAGSATTAAAAFGAITPVTAGALIAARRLCVHASGVAMPPTYASTNMTLRETVNSTSTTAVNQSQGSASTLWTTGAFTPNFTQNLTTTQNRTYSFALRPTPDAAGVTGTVTASFPALTGSASGSTAHPTRTGTVAASFPLLTGSASGTTAHAVRTGTVAASFPSPVEGGVVGVVRVPGTAATSFPALAASVSGNTAFPTITGAVASSFGALSGSAAGSVRVNGAVAASMPALTGSATGAVPVAGSVAGTMPTMTAAATGTVRVLGAVAGTLPGLTAAASGVVRVTGTVARSFPALTAAITGIGGNANVGTVAGTFPSAAAAASGVVRVNGAMARNFPAMTAAVTGHARVLGAVAKSFPALTGSATGAVRVLGTVNLTLPSLTAAVTGHAVVRGVVAVALPGLTTSGILAKPLTTGGRDIVVVIGEAQTGFTARDAELTWGTGTVPDFEWRVGDAELGVWRSGEPMVAFAAGEPVVVFLAGEPAVDFKADEPVLPFVTGNPDV